jgi:hypothetical protein
LCNQDKLLCKVFRENKKLNLELKSSFGEISSLRSMHNDMSAKPYENCNLIMVNYADLWIVHTQVASQLDPDKVRHSVFSSRNPQSDNVSTGHCLVLPDNVWLHRIMSDYQF